MTAYPASMPEDDCALGVYMHVPFCARACDFCNFYQERPDRTGIQDYLAAMEREFALWPPDRPFETVFWGGGTPGLLKAEDLRRLGRSIQNADTRHLREWTVEMAPGSLREDKLKALREVGVTRISMGVQSFDDELLERLGRPHTRRQVDQAIDLIRKLDFPNWNLDLMFALPGQTLAQWEADLHAAMEREPPHLSTYCLTFEEDTTLWVRLQKGQVHKRSEVEEAAFYERAWDLLASGGYGQYEVSNFARSGYACIHNLNTWRMHEWVGYGPSASSQLGQRRWTNAHDLEAWAAGVAAARPARVDEVALTPNLLAQDSVVFGLRMNEGIDLRLLRKRYPQADWPALNGLLSQLAEEAFIEVTHERWTLTRSGRLLADAIGSAVIEAMDADALASAS